MKMEMGIGMSKGIGMGEYDVLIHVPIPN